MLCEIYFYYRNNDLKNIEEILQTVPKPYKVITDNYNLKKSLCLKGIEVNTLNELYGENANHTSQLYRYSKKLLAKYKELFKNTKYKNVEIFFGMENRILEQIILSKKCQKILEGTKNTIFIFKKFSFTFFTIKKIARELGYDSNDDLKLLHPNKISIINPKSRQRLLLFKNNIYTLIERYFTSSKFNQTSSHKEENTKSGNNKSQFLISEKSRHNIREQVFKRVKIYLRIEFRTRYYNFLHDLGIDPIKKFLKSFDVNLVRVKQRKPELKSKNESKSMPVTKNFEYGFFLTTNDMDFYLPGVYPLIDKFSQEKKDFQIFTNDLATSLILTKKKISFVDIFEDVNVLANVIKKTNVGKQIVRQIEVLVKENNLSIIYYQKFSERLIRDLFKAIATIHLCDYLFSEMKIKSLIIATDGLLFGNSVTATSKKYLIPSFFIPPAIINKSPLVADFYHSDYICLNGEQHLESLKYVGYSDKRLVLTGNPKYDFFSSLSIKKSKGYLEKNHHIDSSKRLIVIGMARWHEDDDKWMSDFIEFCNLNKWEIVIKIHPMYKYVLQKESEEKINNIKNRCKNLKYFITYDIDLYTLLSASDLVITEYSNVGAEAILLDKPVITVNFFKESFEHEQNYSEYGGVLYYETYSHMKEVVKEMMDGGKYLDQLKKDRKKAAYRYNYRNDGKATERIYNLVTNPSKMLDVI